MPGQMIHYGDERGHFLYRVAGVAVIDGKVLVHYFEGDPNLFCLPGGRVEMGESAEEAVAREMREELGCEARIERLLWIVDNHFVHNGLVHHELGLYFAITLPEGSPQLSGRPWIAEEENGAKLFFHWQPLDRLGELDLKPSCLIERLRELPAQPVYVVHRELDAPPAPAPGGQS